MAKPKREAGPAFSIVIPVYNEVDNLEPLHEEMVQVFDKLGKSYEIIYVNDGSRDGSIEKLLEIQKRAACVVVVDLRRNFGQTAAIAAGVDHSRGDAIVLMDADMQNDPHDVGMLLARLDEGNDVVSGWRKDRHDVFLTRRLPSMIANELISYVTGVHLHDYGCTLKAYSRDVMDEVKLYGEMHRFIPVFATASGAKISEVVVNHRARTRGKSKYGLWRTFKVILDLITVKFLLSYRTTPMYLFGSLGMLLMAGGVFVLILAVLNKFVEHVDLIYTPLPQLAATLFTMGVQSVLLGLLAELLMRTYYEAQDKAPYTIRGIHGRDE